MTICPICKKPVARSENYYSMDIENTEVYFHFECIDNLLLLKYEDFAEWKEEQDYWKEYNYIENKRYTE